MSALEGDIRTRLSRFKEENFEHNFAIVDALKAVAEKQGVTPAQLCLAWVSSSGSTVIPLAGSSYVAALALSACPHHACHAENQLVHRRTWLLEISDSPLKNYKKLTMSSTTTRSRVTDITACLMNRCTSGDSSLAIVNLISKASQIMPTSMEYLLFM